MNLSGNFDSTKFYKKLDVVSYQGSSYAALQDTAGNLPTDTNYWQLIAEKGDMPSLSNYYDKSEVDSFLEDKVDNDALNNYYNKSEIDLIIGNIGEALDEIQGEVI